MFSAQKFQFFASLRFVLVGLVPLFFTAVSTQGFAESPSNSLDSQRFHYQKAKLALARGNLSEYHHHYAELGDYPLKQYLEFGRIRKNLDQLAFDEIDSFLNRYPDTFLASRLTVNVLNTLAQKKQWADYLKYYDPEIRSTSLKCHALYAQTTLEQPLDMTAVAEVWDVPRSQPKACDPLFDSLLQNNKLPQELIWSRFYKSVSAGKIGLARYLQKKMPAYKEYSDLLLKVHANPSLVWQRSKLQNQDLPTQQIIAHGVTRLARSNPQSALREWELYEAQQLFPEELQRDTKLYVVKRLIRKGHTREAEHLLSYSHQLREQTLVESIIREALEALDWERVNATIALLEPEIQQEERWQYWRARAQDELGKSIPGFMPSQEVYRQLSGSRSFYGFLSADKLSQAYSLEDQSSKVSPEQLAEVSNMEVMRRIYELWLTGNLREARAEWIHSSVSFSPEQLVAVGQLARDWGWYNTGIQAMISGNLWNELTVRFPLAYREQFYKIASDTRVEPTLLYAIARQESAFNESARSPVGAMGLMQVMPATARYTAKLSGVPHSATEQLFDAEHNMLIGGHYLSHLLEQFEGNRILAAAAYNAGPHRVNRWLSAAGQERPYDVWIETIPFRETRHYVQNILCYSVIYGYRLGQPTSFISPEEANRFL